MKSIFVNSVLISSLLTGCIGSSKAAECDRFVKWVAPAKNSYILKHQIFPVPENLKQLALSHMPRLWVHPDSWHPISFEDYLVRSKLVRRSDGSVLMVSPSAKAIAELSQEAQCDAYLEAEDVLPVSPAPLYIQVFQDQSPVSSSELWTYIKYNPVFNWSGLANRISWVSHLLGIYIGRDGPPGFNYYAPPSYIPLPDFAAMGYWQAGNMDLLNEISPLLKDFKKTDWNAILKIMRRRLKIALAEE